MIATLKLQNLYFWKTYYGPVLTIFLPIIILAILGNIYHIEYILPGVIAATIMIIGLLMVPLAIMELKSSSLFKYIGSSPVSPWRFSFITIAYYAILSFGVTLLLLIFTMIMFHAEVWATNLEEHPFGTGFKHGALGGIFGSLVGSTSFIISIMLHIAFSLMLGILIATFAKTPQQALTNGLIIALPSLFLSGMIVSVDIIAESPVLNWFSRFTPFRYTVGNIVISSTPLDFLSSAQHMLERLPFYHRDPIDGGIYVINDENLWKNFVMVDDTLKKLLDTKATHIISDNNIFDWGNDWGSIKVPSMTKLRSFVTEYLNGDGTVNTNRFETILDNMKAGQYDWLDVFFKQSNLLYFKAERGLAVLMPLVACGAMGYVVSKKFTWSTR